MGSLRLSGLGGRGGSGLFILESAGEGGIREFRSEGGAFSLDDFCFRNDFNFELGFGEDEDGDSHE